MLKPVVFETGGQFSRPKLMGLMNQVAVRPGHRGEKRQSATGAGMAKHEALDRS